MSINYIESPKTVAEYDALCTKMELSLESPAPNSCKNCRFYETCGYSAKRTNNKGNTFFGPCILGFMSSGSRFFQPKPEV